MDRFRRRMAGRELNAGQNKTGTLKRGCHAHIEFKVKAGEQDVRVSMVALDHREHVDSCEHLAGSINLEKLCSCPLFGHNHNLLSPAQRGAATGVRAFPPELVPDLLALMCGGLRPPKIHQQMKVRARQMGLQARWELPDLWRLINKLRPSNRSDAVALLSALGEHQQKSPGFVFSSFVCPVSNVLRRVFWMSGEQVRAQEGIDCLLRREMRARAR